MNNYKNRIIGATLLLASALLAACAGHVLHDEPAAGDALAAGFLDPPDSARPRVWWHWISGNISKDGIRKDLEWMRRVGIGGLQHFDVALGARPVVEQRVTYMSPAWKDAFRHAVTLADALGLEFTIAGSPGWSETGGPWVAPQDGMKKLVWSETRIEGGRRFQGLLAPPPGVTGPFQAMVRTSAEQHYADVAVLAVPEKESHPPLPPPQLFQDDAVLDPASLLDDSLETGLSVPVGTAEAPEAVVLRYPRMQTIRSATVFIRHAATLFSPPALRPQLQVRAGAGWRTLAELPLAMVPTTVSFAPVKAREFRLLLAPNPAPNVHANSPAPGVVVAGSGGASPRPRTMKIATLQLSAEPRVNQFEAKAGFSIANDYFALNEPTDLPGVAPAQVIDLGNRLQPDGRLDWTPPAGRWKLLRLGYSLTGATNAPANPEATGLEVDKYDATAVRRYLEKYYALYRDAVGDDRLIGARGLQALLLDSTEVGASNWTPRLVEQFQRLRGYDPRPWLPALTGVIVGSRAQSDAFLYDFRRTLAELTAREHYGEVARFAHEHGLKLYSEALESGRPSLGDDMAMRAAADVPMAALWTNTREEGDPRQRIGDLKGAASVAHVYGQNLAAAESLTSAGWPWAHAPADLKRVIDFEFAQGINRPVIHTSVHQPVDDRLPGLSLAIFGQYFNRHETWAEMARPWIDYIARSSFLLQQGRHVADVAYFHGEEAPLTALHAAGPLRDTPRHHAYDFLGADALLNELGVENGELQTRSGARYRVLYLGGSSGRMTLPVLRRLAALVEAGATVVGLAPEASPSLADDDREFRRLRQQLWPGASVTTLGQGRVIASRDVEAALASIGVGPDFRHEGGGEVLFLHRRLADGSDIYFLNSRLDRPRHIEARFRVRGKLPEIWRADTGTIEPVSFRTEGAETRVPLELQAEDAFFVVFRRAAAAAAETVSTPVLQPVATLDGRWDVAFQPGRGAPGTLRLDALQALNEHSDPGIRYFSGVSTYRKVFTLPQGVDPGASLILDLGQVGDLAELHVNGQPMGTAWKAPWQLDIGKALRRGENVLEVRVANLWVNRLIGDAQPGAQQITSLAMRTYRPDAPLRPSGLIGPVRLLASAVPSGGANAQRSAR